jgi:hypothetical protein
MPGKQSRNKYRRVKYNESQEEERVSKRESFQLSHTSEPMSDHPKRMFPKVSQCLIKISWRGNKSVLYFYKIPPGTFLLAF